MTHDVAIFYLFHTSSTISPSSARLDIALSVATVLQLDLQLLLLLLLLLTTATTYYCMLAVHIQHPSAGAHKNRLVDVITMLKDVTLACLP